MVLSFFTPLGTRVEECLLTNVDFRTLPKALPLGNAMDDMLPTLTIITGVVYLLLQPWLCLR